MRNLVNIPQDTQTHTQLLLFSKLFCNICSLKLCKYFLLNSKHNRNHTCVIPLYKQQQWLQSLNYEASFYSMCSFIYLSFLSSTQHFSLNDPQSTSTLKNTKVYNHETVTSLLWYKYSTTDYTVIKISLREQHRCGTLQTFWHRNQISSLVALQALRCKYMNIINSPLSLYHYHKY